MTFKQAIRAMVFTGQCIGVHEIKTTHFDAMTNQDYGSLKYWLIYDYTDEPQHKKEFIDRLDSNDWYLE